MKWVLALFAGVIMTAEIAGQHAGFITYTHTGICDASAVAALGTNYFVAANDEENTLSTYRTGLNGAPVQQLNLTGFLQVDRKEPEVDLEGGARIGDRIYWISSHGRNKSGKLRLSRHRFFATEVDGSANPPSLKFVGRPYTRILTDLLSDPKFASLDLDDASRRPPKDKGGFNIEGLAEGPDGSLLIGLRNPIPQGKAAIIPLLNPAKVIEGEKAQFGAPIRLDLEGLGVRDLLRLGGKYYVLAGPYKGGPPNKVFTWDGSGDDAKVFVDLQGFNGEALFAAREGRDLWVLSDEGSAKVDGGKCKDLKDPRLKNFRSLRVELPESK